MNNHRLVFDWVVIPSGEFIIGSKVEEKWAFRNEMPQHSLYLPEFLIARTPTTVAQFDTFVKATGYRTTAEKEEGSHGLVDGTFKDIRGANWKRPNGTKPLLRSNTVAKNLHGR